ncbi:hypothetical protein [Dyadobacter tibetensis]|uniref:hypothetical protein n=1 Tax=Dyadobacter tibetensis TaxID=1211851 RepID=UPI00046F7D29|nr:hypothetical protein [Dyadobacter tibetensis]
MKHTVTLLTSLVLHLVITQLSAQTIYPGKKNIDKTDYFGLFLNQNIPEKQLIKYWEVYLGQYGKVKEKRGVVRIERASVPQLSANPVLILSEISSPSKGQSQLFMTFAVDGRFIESYSGNTYTTAESILKEFASRAAAKNEVQLADDAFSDSEKTHKKLIREGEDLAKDIERMEKKLSELRQSLERNRSEIELSITDLQNKQKALEMQKGRLPK